VNDHTGYTVIQLEKLQSGLWVGRHDTRYGGRENSKVEDSEREVEQAVQPCEYLVIVLYPMFKYLVQAAFGQRFTYDLRTLNNYWHDEMELM
jgi:hypothetical protein